jgi:hypothetical protein
MANLGSPGGHFPPPIRAPEPPGGFPPPKKPRKDDPGKPRRSSPLASALIVIAILLAGAFLVALLIAH